MNTFGSPSPAYFYVWQPGIPVGHVIAPGRWGGIIQSMGVQHQNFLRETVWELVRRARSPESVSRLECTFVYDDVDTARGQSNGQSIYVVTAEDEDARWTRVDMAYIDAVKVARTVDELEELAVRYWTGQSTQQPKWEILTTSPLRVQEVTP